MGESVEKYLSFGRGFWVVDAIGGIDVTYRTADEVSSFLEGSDCGALADMLASLISPQQSVDVFGGPRGDVHDGHRPRSAPLSPARRA